MQQNNWNALNDIEWAWNIPSQKRQDYSLYQVNKYFDILNEYDIICDF